jgi:hypothetical protein
MQMVKIRIVDGEKRAEALLPLMRRGRVVCFPDDVFIVPEPALALLQGMNVPFQELGRGGIDYAEKALRDSVAAPA